MTAGPSGDGETVVGHTAGWVLAYSPEYGQLSADAQLLGSIAELTGGRSLDELEIEEAVDYDYIVVNDDVKQAIAEVNGIIDTEVRRPARLPNMDEFLNTLRDVLLRSAEELSGSKE